MANTGSPTVTPPSATSKGIDNWFELTKRGSTIGREIRGGLVTFFTMAYIIVLNPLIIGTATDVNGNLVTGKPKFSDWSATLSPDQMHSIVENVNGSIAAVAAVTALIAGVMTILMGVWARFPIALATGLGLNALLAYAIAPKMTWPQAMGLVVWEGVLITILVLTGFRKAILNAVPRPTRAAISVGIGLFIAFIGLYDAGVVRQPSSGATPVELGISGALKGWPIAIFLVTLLLLIILYVRKVKGAILIAIISGTVLAVIMDQFLKIGGLTTTNPTGWKLNVPVWLGFKPLDFSLIGRVDLFGGFATAAGPGAVLGILLLVFSLLLSDFFDTMGTMVAVAAEGDLLQEDGNPPHSQEILLVDSIAAIAGGLGSVSSNTSYIESASGVGEGARTGIASVVTGLAFLLSILLAPLVNMVPSEAAAPALFFVGFLMMSQVVEIDWTDPEVALPGFLTIVLMPFTYSITTGIGAGFIAYALIKVVRGKAKDVHPLLYGVAAAFLIYFAQGLISGMFPAA